MKPRSIRVLWISGLVLAVSAPVFSRVSDSLNSSAAHPSLAALASFYKSSDPSLLATTFITERQLATPADLNAGSSGKADFSAYVHLHLTRADNLAPLDGID